MEALISLLLFSVSVVFYTLSQAVMHGKIKDNPDGKYATPKRPGIGFYYRLFGITYKERFFLSATLLVCFTDKYHAFQAVFKILLCAAIVAYQEIFNPVLDAFMYLTVWGIVFSISYRLCGE